MKYISDSQGSSLAVCRILFLFLDNIRKVKMHNNTLLVEDTATETLRKSNYQDIERECRERQKWTHIYV